MFRSNAFEGFRGSSSSSWTVCTVGSNSVRAQLFENGSGGKVLSSKKLKSNYRYCCPVSVETLGEDRVDEVGS